MKIKSFVTNSHNPDFTFVATLISLEQPHIFEFSNSELRAVNSCDAKHHMMDVVTEANLSLFSSYKVSTVLKHSLL